MSTGPDQVIARLASRQWGVVSADDLRRCGLSYILAATKACNGVLSHFSAAALYGLVRWDDRYPEVTTPAQRAHTGIRVHRSSMLEVRDVTHHKGIPTTTPPEPSASSRTPSWTSS